MKNSTLHRSLFVGPMSQNIVDAAILHSDKVGLIPSRRQVDSSPRGYVNNWSTQEFLEYTSGKGITRCRDHAGPLQGQNVDDGFGSLTTDCSSENFFEIIHIDPWKKEKNVEKAAEMTSDMIMHCHNLNSTVFFEIGTEQAIREYSRQDLDLFLSFVEKRLKRVFEKILYCVVQGGTLLEGNLNIGCLNESKLSSMIELCKERGLFSKEHNGDYLTKDQISKRFKCGLNSINIAPEFGFKETELFISKLGKNDILKVFDLCFSSKRWVKWLPEKFNVKNEDDRLQLIKVSCHYLFSHPEIQNIRRQIGLSEKEVIDLHSCNIEKIHAVIEESRS